MLRWIVGGVVVLTGGILGGVYLSREPAPKGEHHDPAQRVMVRDLPGDPASVAPVRTEATAAGTPDEWLEEAFSKWGGINASAREKDLAGLLKRLRAAGPRGLAAIGTFLRSGRDLSFGEGLGFASASVSRAPTLRVALIDALREWPGAAGTMLEVLRSSHSTLEITLAIRTLEAQFPGTYRHEALRAVERQMANPAASGDETRDVFVYQVARHFQATEILPTMEAWVKQAPEERLAPYSRMISGFAADAQAASVERVFSAEGMGEAFAATPHTFGHYAYAGEPLRNTAAFTFSLRWTAEQKRVALESLAENVRPPGESWFLPATAHPEEVRKQREAMIAETKGRKELLAAIAPAADTPELQAALKEARKAVTTEVAALEMDRRTEASPAEEVAFASGEGKAVIKGRRIESLELQTSAEPLLDLDSTSESPR